MSIDQKYDYAQSEPPSWLNQAPPIDDNGHAFSFDHELDTYQPAILTYDQQRDAFFDAIWPNRNAHDYFCTFGRGSRVSWDVQDIASFVRNNTHTDLYFGIGQTNKAGTSGQRASRNGKGPHVASIACLFGDFDGQDFDSEISRIKQMYKDEDKAAKKAGRKPLYSKLPKVDPAQGKAGAWQALELAESKVGQASFVIDSGGGYQAYWLLDEPIIIRQMLDAEDVRALFANWQVFIGADKSAKDLERVYRVPFSYNCKSHYADGPLFATIARSDSTITHDVRVIRDIVTPRQSKMDLTGQRPAPKPVKVVNPTIVGRTATEKTEAEHARDIALAVGYLARFSQERCDVYGDWLNVGCALKHRFGGTEQEDRAFFLWDEWSKNSKSYGSTEAHKAKWQSIKPTAKALGFGSLAYWAEQDSPEEQDMSESVDLLSFEVNDAGNMDAFRALYGASFRHVEEWGWLSYMGTHWERQGAQKQVFGHIRDMLRGRIQAALGLCDEDKLKRYLRNCAPTTKNMNACHFQVKNDIELDERTSGFDRHHFLINVANGTLDLRDGTLTPHDPTQMLTHCLDTAFNPNADVTLVTKFLSGLGLSESVISYLQEGTGYTLTGSTREEIMFYIYGPTRSGKGTFVSALRSLLGSTLSAEITFETLTESKESADAQNFALAPLKPCRLLVASESGKYSTLNEAKIKRLTGGDSIFCAFKGKTHFNYTPSFKIWLTSNHPPKADVNDDAIWKSRLKLVEFPNSFLGAEDKGLKDKLMNDPAHKEALLFWAVQGAVKWFNSPNGLQAPPEVVAATQTARDQLDYIRQWLDECTEDDEARTTNAELYASYEGWCDENGVSAKKKRAFTRDMSNKGYQPKRWKQNKKTVRGFAGLIVVTG